MALFESIGKTYFEIDLDGEEKVRVRASRADIGRVRANAQNVIDACNALGDDASEEEVEDAVRGAFRLLCGDEAGDEIYEKSLAYAGGGLPVTECADEMAAAVGYVAEAWAEYMAAREKRAAEIERHYLGGAEDAI